MPPKDILEKTLEAYNDVFTDICNGLLFGGRRLISEDSLEDAQTASFYKAEDSIRALDRDVAKYVADLNAAIRIAKVGYENQTQYDPQMPLRIIGYDGADYRNQYGSANPYPVITLVLSFSEARWGRNRSLHDVLNIPEAMKPYVSDYRINVFEIAYLSDEEIDRFHSDFRAIADLIAHRRVNPDYVPERGGPDFDHPEEVRQLMSVITGDRRYLEEDLPPERRSKNMDQYLDRLENRGVQRGIAQAEAAAIERDKRRVQRLFAKGFKPEEIADDMELDLAQVREWLSSPSMA